MWAIIPPVIAAMFASYSMFAFIAGLHWLDIRSVKKTLEECLGLRAPVKKILTSQSPRNPEKLKVTRK